MNIYKGKCLCGSCRYVITGEKPQAMYLCHCSMCRKETGTIHSANVFFDKAQILWEKGEYNITFFKLENTQKQCAFCKFCGSPLPRQDNEYRVVLPAGTLDNDTSLTPTAHIFYASRASFEEEIWSCKKFDELPQ